MPTMVQPGSNDTERLLTLFLNANEGPVNLASVYAPSLSTTSQEPRTRCHHLEYNKQSSNEQIISLSDFNAGVDADYHSWPSCLGQFGVDEMN